MLVRSLFMAAVALAVIAGAALLLADEKASDIGVPEPVARAGEAEWIRSVSGDTAQVWAVGDANPPASAKVARLIRRAQADRLLYLGDVYPEGTAEDFDRWAKPFEALLGRMAPTSGNHEWENAREGYEPFWREVTGEPPPAYYSFEAGGWEILSLNSAELTWRAARDWLREQVRPGGNCRIAFWHHPPRSAGRHKDGPRSVDRFVDVLEGRARLILAGHDHNSQRMRPREGIVEFIAGAGGRHLYDVNERDDRLAFSDDKRFIALRLDLAPGKARWRFVTVGGKVVDRGSLGCRAS